MDYSRLINEYLEGELEIVEEQKLFSEMAYNDALREEFTSEVKLSNIFAADAAYETTPVEATDGVFAQLGFSIPTAAGKTVAGGFWRKFSRTSIVAALLLLGTLVTSGILYMNGSLFNSEGNYSESSNVKSSAIKSSNASDSEQSNSNISGAINSEEMESFFDNFYEIVSNSLRFKSDNSDRSNGNLMPQDNVLALSNNKNSNNKEMQDNNKVHSANSLMKLINQSNVHIFYSGQINSSQMMPGDFVVFPMNSEILSKSFDNKKYSLQTKGALNNYYPNIENINIDNMNSFEIAFWYNADEKNSIGFTFGRSNFAQQFNTSEGMQYYQAPELFWLGASYKRMFFNEELFGFLMPYSSIMAGASSIGPVFKLESGMEILVSGNFRFFIGAEGNTLLYNVDGKIYNSNNIGLIYGLKYSF